MTIVSSEQPPAVPLNRGGQPSRVEGSQGELSPSILLVGNFLSASSGCRGACEELVSRLRGVGWQVFTTSARPRRMARLLDMLWTTWNRRREYSLAHVDVFSGPACFWAEAVCWTLRRAGKPYLLTLHGGNLPAFARKWRGRVRRLLTSAVAVTAPSRYLKEQMQLFRPDIQLVPNPIDLVCYRFTLRERISPRLVWLRAFHAMYDPSLAVETLALVSEDFPASSLVMVGPDKGDGSLQQAQSVADSLGVNDRITWAGSVSKDQVPEWLNRGDIFLNTTRFDNTPVSVIEAMASGLCVVSTKVGGIPYLLEHEVDALLVPSQSPESMAAAIRRFLTEPGLAARLSSNARRKAEQFDWSRILPHWEKLLASVMTRKV